MSRNSKNILEYNNRGIDLVSFGIFNLFIAMMLLSCIAFREVTQSLFFIALLVIYMMVIMFKCSMFKYMEFSFYLAVPIFMSAFQNVYLGVVAPFISGDQVEIMIITNFLFSIMLFIIMLFNTPNRLGNKVYKENMIILIAIVVYSMFTIIAFGANIMSAFASLRNIITPIFFLLLGLIASSNVNEKKFLRYISYITILVVLFGIIELYFSKDIWHQLNLGDLWTKKGIPVNAYSGMPNNFYSSEIVNGQQIRRMVSSFADPVNLGTFLFFGLMASWYLNKRIVWIIILICCGLAVSKGALLGILVFCIVWAYYTKSRGVFIGIFSLSSIAGGTFALYSLNSSTMSMVAHINGLIASFTELIYHPLGRGLGNIGVLAGLYSTGSVSNITESGLGMVIGQLGIVGVVLYTYFFWIIYKNIRLIKNKRDKIFLYSIFGGIILNIMFNEVALSPNSSAIYFIAIGIFIGKLKKESIET